MIEVKDTLKKQFHKEYMKQSNSVNDDWDTYVNKYWSGFLRDGLAERNMSSKDLYEAGLNTDYD